MQTRHMDNLKNHITDPSLLILTAMHKNSKSEMLSCIGHEDINVVDTDLVRIADKKATFYRSE